LTIVQQPTFGLAIWRGDEYIFNFLSAIGLQSRSTNKSRALVLIVIFCNFIQRQLRAYDFQIPPHRQAVAVGCYSMRTDTILLIPQKSDDERESVLNAWIKLGGQGQKLDRFWEKPTDLENKNIAVYGNDTFALVIAQLFNLKLVSPDDSLIARLDKKWVKRMIEEKHISDLTGQDFPGFIKPVTPKQFKGKVYLTLNDFLVETHGLPVDEKILVSEILKVDSEARSFILNNQILDLAIYEGQGNLDNAKRFLSDFLNESDNKLPATLVIDIGYNLDVGWFIIEFNSSWGAGLNNCDPNKVIESILFATQK